MGIVNYKMFSIVNRLYVILYSYIYRKYFRYCGKGVRFEKVSLLVGGQDIVIGDNTTFQKGLYMTAWHYYGTQKFTPNIQIGDNCNFGAFNHITCTNRIVIGNNVLTGKWVTISDNNHGNTSYTDMKMNPQDRKITSKGEIHIGDRVFIGDKATILSGVDIGEGSIIGANTVVTKKPSLKF